MRSKYLTTLAIPLLCAGPALAQGPNISNAVPIAGLGTFAFDTTGFSPSGVNSSCGVGLQIDGWFAWNSGPGGAYSFLICDSPTFDTSLALYTSGGTQIGCSAGGACTPDPNVSELSPGVLQPSTTYYIQVTGGFGATGSGLLDIFGPPPISGDECLGGTIISGEGTFPFSTVGSLPSGFDTGCGSGVESDFWFRWTSGTMGGDYRFSVCPAADYDVVAAARDTCGGPVIACSDAEGCTSSLNDLDFTISDVTSFDTYWIQITGWNGAVGSGSLLVEALPPANNSCFSAQPIAGEGVFAWNNSQATTSGDGSPVCLKDGVDQIYNDVWFEWSPGIVATGTYRIMTCAETTLDTKIAVYAPGAGGCLFLGEPFVCGDQECGNQTIVTVNVPTFNLNPYYIRLGSFNANATGSGDLIIERVAVGGDIGTNYCVSAPNSVGATGAFISATGSASVSANDFTLSVAPVPPGSPGIFYYGPGQTQDVFGDGFRCVSAPLIRLPAVFATLTQTASYTLDLSAFPASDSISAGVTRNFQYWYRDPSGGLNGFNLSNGLSVGFLP